MSQPPPPSSRENDRRDASDMAAPMAVPICRDCIYWRPSFTSEPGFNFSRCAAPGRRSVRMGEDDSLVNGRLRPRELTYCRGERSYGECGKGGKLVAPGRLPWLIAWLKKQFEASP